MVGDCVRGSNLLFNVVKMMLGRLFEGYEFGCCGFLFVFFSELGCDEKQLFY